jgi:hypothetical protein
LDRLVGPRRAAVAHRRFVGDRLLGSGWATLVRRPVVLDRLVGPRRAAVTHRWFVAARSAFAGRTVVTGWAAFADRLVFAGHLAGVAVARRLAAAALLRRRGRLLLRRGLAAGRLRRSGRPVTPLRGRGAFAPRTTRTLGW